MESEREGERERGRGEESLSGTSKRVNLLGADTTLSPVRAYICAPRGRALFMYLLKYAVHCPEILHSKFSLWAPLARMNENVGRVFIRFLGEMIY